jgi:hypothetical protein
VKGRFRYSDLKEAAPGDYGICFSMRRSLSFARWRLLSVCFRFSCSWQREWSCTGMSESRERTTMLPSEECETENQCARRSASEIGGWRCGFMGRTG